MRGDADGPMAHACGSDERHRNGLLCLYTHAMRTRTLERRTRTKLGAPSAGDYRWDGERWRRWNGVEWASALYSLRTQRLSDPRPLSEDSPRDDEVRAWALERAVQDQALNNQAQVLTKGPDGAVLAFKPKIAHLAHALMTLITSGLWAAFWIYRVLTARGERYLLEVDAWGHVWATRGA